MGAGEWITAVIAAGGFIAWMTAMWIRAGRILQRIDDIASDQLVLKQQSLDHETRITRLEAVLNRRSR
jgi:hypothetical protein